MKGEARAYSGAELSGFGEQRGDSEGFEDVGRDENVAVDVPVELRSEDALRVENQVAENGEVEAVVAVVALDDDAVGAAEIGDVGVFGEHDDTDRFVLLIER